MKNTFIKTYFAAFKKIGVSTELQLFRMRKDQVIQKVSYDHADYDGIAAIVDLAKKSGSSFTPPKTFYTPEPSLLVRLRELAYWYVKFWPFKPSHWISKGKGQRVSAWSEFPSDKNLSSNDLNVHLLLSLDKTAIGYLKKPEHYRMWMVPVSLYEKIDQTIDGGNKVSFIDIKIDKSTTTQTAKEQIRQSLKRKNYWGTLLTLKPAAFVGVHLFALFLKTAHLSFRRTGTLTNMGEWTISSLPEDEWWVFGDGMVALMNPVVGTAMVVNSRLGVSIIFHESLGMTHENADLFLAEWKSNFSAMIHPTPVVS